MDLPALPLEPWVPTKRTLHLQLQVVGKVRLALHPPLNHWWHVPVYVGARGFTTRAIPTDGDPLEIEHDLVDGRLRVRRGAREAAPLALEDGLTIQDFHAGLQERLADVGLEAAIRAVPFDSDRVGSATPFAEDREHHHWDAEAVQEFWRVVAFGNRVLHRFAADYAGKASPVHLFWHSLDLAYTRFSGRAAPLGQGGRVAEEAYSHEVISVGFWPGDDDVPFPAFYAYAYPEPDGLAEVALEGEGAAWHETPSGTKALLAWDAVREADDPEAALLAFCRSVYDGAARRAGWDVEGLRRTWD